MNIDLKQLAAKIENWLRQPLHSLTLLVVWTGWLMAATMAWSNLYRQIKFGPVFPFVSTAETGLNLIAVMKAELGDLDRVKRIVKILGMVNATPEFGRHPEVINGCSDLMVEVFGERGRHARSAVGMGSLPRGIPVEIEVIVEVDDMPARKAAASQPAVKAKKKSAQKKSAKKKKI